MNPTTIIFSIYGMLGAFHPLRSFAITWVIIGWSLFLLAWGILIYAILQPKARIACQSDKMTLEDSVIPLENVAFVNISFPEGMIRKFLIHVRNPAGTYILECFRMKDLLSIFKFVDFLREKGISVTYT